MEKRSKVILHMMTSLDGKATGSFWGKKSVQTGMKEYFRIQNEKLNAQAMAYGRKTFEIRKNDRGFEVGDTLILKEWNPTYRMPTGREQHCEITYILEGNKETVQYGLKEGFCIMSIIQKW